MHEQHVIVNQIETILILLLISSAVAICVKWIRLPYSIALVIAGLGITTLHFLPYIGMTPELIMMVFLPALLFEASWNIRFDELRHNLKPIVVLATVGVIISLAVTSFLIRQFAGLEISTCLLIGIMISATDPISVLAMFRKLGLDARLSCILEGESLFNDGVAVVLFKLFAVAAVAGGTIDFTQLVSGFASTVFGGIAIGIAAGLLSSRITRYFDDHLLEITFTTIVAYGSYLMAEHLHVSSVLAVIAAGLVLGNFGSREAMSPSTRMAVDSFWEYAAFLVNSLVFLLIGLEIDWLMLVENRQLILISIGAVLVSRLVVVYGLCPLLSSKKYEIPTQWRHLLVWGALRGSLSMALALSLPVDCPQRSSIIVAVFGVVLFTLLVQGLTIEPLVNFLKVGRSDTKLKSYSLLKSRLVSLGKALDELKQLHKRHEVSTRLYDRQKKSIEAEIDQLRLSIDQLALTNSKIDLLESIALKTHLLGVQKDSLRQQAYSGKADYEIIDELIGTIDRQVEKLTCSEAEEEGA